MRYRCINTHKTAEYRSLNDTEYIKLINSWTKLTQRVKNCTTLMFIDKQCNSVARDLPLTGSEASTTSPLCPGFGLVCYSLTSLCHINGHIETMPDREINPFTALTRIWSQFLMTQWWAIISEWTRLRLRPLSHWGLALYPGTRIYIPIKIEMTKNFFDPPPPTHTTPHPWDKKSEQGNGGYIGYRFPLSLSTIWGNHLPFNFMLKFPIYYLEKPLPITSKWRGVTVPKRKVEHTVSEGAFFFQKFIKNCIKHEENMKWERNVFLNPPPPHFIF